MIVFINGKQKRVRRPPMIEGLPDDEFIRRNAGPVWLHQHGYWEILDERVRATEQGGEHLRARESAARPGR